LIEAQIYSDLDEPEFASEPLERVLKADAPSLQKSGVDRSKVVPLAARVNLRLGRPERALEILDSAPGVERNRESRWLASRAFLQQDKASEAASALSTVPPRAAADPRSRPLCGHHELMAVPRRDLRVAAVQPALGDFP
jgi:hypothetical protein